jgi:hypothetical protein
MTRIIADQTRRGQPGYATIRPPFRILENPSNSLRLRSIFCALLMGLMFAAGASGQDPRPLPAPDVPLSSIPPAASGVKTRTKAPYAGPPAGIDGPELLVPSTGDSLPPEIVLDDGELLFGEIQPDSLLGPQPQKLTAYKDGFFQKLSLSAGWLGNRGDPADLAVTEFDTFVQVGLPAPIIEWPLLITPGLNLSLIDGPTLTDVPPRLYVTYVDFMWLPQIVRGYTLLLSAAPTLYGDFDAHEFRMTGKSLLIVDAIPGRVQLVGGLLYLNRDNIRLLPAGGAIWTPEDWARLELIFPKPKIGLRFNVGTGYEDWVYAAAEFGGNTWPIVRATGQEDKLTYIDYRLLLGVERKLNGGAGFRLEAGYVLGRSVEFASGQGDFDPQDTILLRGGITY